MQSLLNIIFETFIKQLASLGNDRLRQLTNFIGVITFILITAPTLLAYYDANYLKSESKLEKGLTNCLSSLDSIPKRHLAKRITNKLYKIQTSIRSVMVSFKDEAQGIRQQRDHVIFIAWSIFLVLWLFCILISYTKDNF